MSELGKGVYRAMAFIGTAAYTAVVIEPGQQTIQAGIAGLAIGVGAVNGWRK